MLRLKRWQLFKMISDGEFFKEGPSEINIVFGEEAEQLRALIADFNGCQQDWFLKIHIDETNLDKWFFKFKPLNRESFIFYRNKKIEKLQTVYKNRTWACRAAHTLFSFEEKVVESVKELSLLAKCARAPLLNDDDNFKTLNTKMCVWCDNVSPTFLELSVPRKLSVISILYGKYIGEDPLEPIENEKDSIGDIMKLKQ